MYQHHPRPGHAERRRPQPSATPAAARRPEQHALLQLQRTAGNAAVTAMVARYEAGEHAQMGHDEPLIKFKGVAVSEGELIALGDFYASSEDMSNADPTELAELVRLIRQDKDAFEGVPGVKPVTTEDWKKALAGREPGKQYFDLLADNEAHFAGDNKTEFFVNHRKALKIAHAAAGRSNEVPTEARVVNGWACHYLTDAFSAGHLFDKDVMLERVRQAWGTIDEAWGPDQENTVTRGVAAGVFADPDAVRLLAGYEVPTPGGGMDITQDRFSKILMAMSYFMSDKFLNVILNLVHDRLDASVGDAETAIEVVNKRGDRWKLAGDKSLALSSETLMFARQAVAHAGRNLELAARTADDSSDEPWISEVWDYTPQPTYAGAAKMETTIGDVLDLTSDTTIAQFSAKMIENLGAGIPELVEKGVLRAKPTPGGAWGPTPPGGHWGPSLPKQEWGPKY